MDIVIALLQHYSFDLGGHTVNELIQVWSKYDANWVRLAIIESLYQGRYKAVSVSQILSFWQRKGESCCRFNHEFERLVCGDFVFSLPKLPRNAVQPRVITPIKVTAPSQSPVKPRPRLESTTYKSAVKNMNLLAESSLFVDKLKSMCSSTYATSPLLTEIPLTGELSLASSVFTDD